MTKEEALKLKHGNRIKYTQTGSVFEFLGFETKDLEPPLGDGQLFLPSCSTRMVGSDSSNSETWDHLS